METMQLTELNVLPNVNFLATLRHSGYNNYSAISDIIDNSLDTNVNATDINITIKKTKDNYSYIQIADNGVGMGMEILQEAFKLGAITGKSRESDLGSYGTGLKAASLSLGRAFQVITKTKGDNLYIATYDLDVLLKQDTFTIPVKIGNDADFEKFKAETGSDTGTIIVISKLDRITNSNITMFKTILKEKIGTYYRLFIDELGINIKINDEIVESVDPMYRNEPFTTSMSLGEKIYYKDIEILFNVFNIEKVSDSVDTKIKDKTSGSGLYIYRNKRLVGSGLDLGIIQKAGDGYLNGFRVEMFINGKCDELFGSTFNKMIHEKDKNDLDSDFKRVCHSALKTYINNVKQKGKDERITASVTKEDIDFLNLTMKSINENAYVGIPKAKGKNNPSEDDEKGDKKETVKPGSKPGQSRIRNDKFAEYEFVQLGENGIMFNPTKKDGLYTIQINQDHPFWVNFLANSTLETKDVMLKFFVSLAVSLEETEYYDDVQKEILLNEYFIKVSETLRKFIIY